MCTCISYMIFPLNPVVLLSAPPAAQLLSTFGAGTGAGVTGTVRGGGSEDAPQPMAAPAPKNRGAGRWM